VKLKRLRPGRGEIELLGDLWGDCLAMVLALGVG